MFQRKTLRRLPPDARKLARAYNEAERSLRAMKKAVYLIAEMEWFYRGSRKGVKPEFQFPHCPDHDTYQFNCGGCGKAVLQAAVVNRDDELAASEPPPWEQE